MFAEVTERLYQTVLKDKNLDHKEKLVEFHMLLLSEAEM